MSTVLPRKSLILALVLLACLVGIAESEPLVLIGQPANDGTFISADDAGSLKFHCNDQDFTVTDEQLIRWSNPEPNSRKPELLLRDGSRVVIADSWSSEPSWQLTSDAVTVSTELFGKVIFPRSEVRAILVRAPNGMVPRTRFLEKQIPSTSSSDGFRLVNGDRWEGQRVTIVKREKDERYAELFRDGQSEPLVLPMRQIAAVTLRAPESSLNSATRLVVGTRDGSLAHVVSVSSDQEQLKLRLACGVELSGNDRRDVKYLFSKTTAIEYLSDHKEIGYRHVPYLDIPSKFRRDRNVLGDPLRAQGRVFAKGLGVHTASRLSFDLKRSKVNREFTRFVGSVAVDDAAGRRGSVIFRVYLRTGDDWRQAFESPIVRGGDPPLPVSVELGDATQLALLTDYADRGDELDYANWLEARLE